MQAERSCDRSQQLRFNRTGTQERWRGEREAMRCAANRHQPSAALLDHLLVPRLPPSLEPGVAGSERRMTGERKLVW